MKRKLLIVCCAGCVVCCVGCVKSGYVRTEKKMEQETETQETSEAFPETQETETSYGEAEGYYLMEANEDTAVIPAIEIDGKDGRFMFLYNVLLSNNVQGTFEIKDSILIANADDGKVFLFQIESREVLRFLQKGSSKIMLSDAQNNEKYLADNAKFTMAER